MAASADMVLSSFACLTRAWRIRHHFAIIREIPPRSVRPYKETTARFHRGEVKLSGLNLSGGRVLAIARYLETMRGCYVSIYLAVPDIWSTTGRGK